LPPTCPLFPYTTLFRSGPEQGVVQALLDDSGQVLPVVQAVVFQRAVLGMGPQARAQMAWREVDEGVDSDVFIAHVGLTEGCRWPDRKSTRLNSSHVKIS